MTGHPEHYSRWERPRGWRPRKQGRPPGGGHRASTRNGKGERVESAGVGTDGQKAGQSRLD